MEKTNLTEKAKKHLNVLCAQIGERRVGSEANRMATNYVKGVLEELGWQTEGTMLSVMDWKSDGATLTCKGGTFEVFSSHYSLGCMAEGELLAINSLSQLEPATLQDKIVLLYGEIAAQQIAPKNFPFWNPEEHQYIISLLEKGNPKALLCATERNSATAGGVYPFPLFEDGDFDIPSAYMKDTEGERLLAFAGQKVELVSRATRLPETAFNVVARKGGANTQKRVVISAHIDTKIGTPGAIDNGTGVAVLLLFAELYSRYLAGQNQGVSKDCSPDYMVELVVFNGEYYYGAPGQVKYIEQNVGRFGDILLNINIDGAGYLDGPSCFSPMELAEEMKMKLDEVLKDFPVLVEGLPWYQGDHSLFLQQGCQAIAVSSQWFIEHMESQEITHTPKDNLGIVNYDRVAECAMGIASLICRI